MFENKCYLAPLSDYTNAPFRLLCQRYGAQATIVPLISAKGTTINKNGFTELDPHPDEKFMGVQLFGSKPEDIREAARLVIQDHPNVKFIDINCGCPVRKVMKTGAGSSLLKDPQKVGELILAASKSDIPITIKMRILPDIQKTIDFAKACENAGASALFVHGRTQSQAYSGEADWIAIRVLAESLNIPVIGSGDIKTIEQGYRMQQESKCASFMMGRAAMHDPTVFCGKATQTLQDKLDLFREYHSICESLDRIHFPDLKAKAIQFFYGFRSSSKLRVSLCQSNNLEDLMEAINSACCF
jgi:tRNA-dihydrouridine synthase B